MPVPTSWMGAVIMSMSLARQRREREEKEREEKEREKKEAENQTNGCYSG